MTYTINSINTNRKFYILHNKHWYSCFNSNDFMLNLVENRLILLYSNDGENTLAYGPHSSSRQESSHWEPWWLTRDCVVYNKQFWDNSYVMEGRKGTIKMPSSKALFFTCDFKFYWDSIGCKAEWFTGIVSQHITPAIVSFLVWLCPFSLFIWLF